MACRGLPQWIGMDTALDCAAASGTAFMSAATPQWKLGGYLQSTAVHAVGVASQWFASTKPSSWRFCGVLPLPSTVVGVGWLPGTRC